MGESLGFISGDTHPFQCGFHRFNGLPSAVAIYRLFMIEGVERSAAVGL